MDNVCGTCERYVALCKCTLGPSLQLHGPVYPSCPTPNTTCGKLGYTASYDSRGWYRTYPLSESDAVEIAELFAGPWSKRGEA